MPRTTRRMPPFEGIGASSTSTVRLPIGLTYHQILLSYAGGLTLDMMESIRVIGDGEVFQTYRGATMLDNINQDEGRNAAAGILTLDFDRHLIMLRQGREITALGTNHPEDPRPLSTLSLEIDLGASVPVGASLSAKAIQSSPEPLGLIKKVRRFIYDAPAAGEFEIADLPKGDLINKIYFDAPEITKVKIERDNFVVFERERAENELVRADHGKGAGPFAGFVFDPTEEDYGSESLVTERVRDLRVTLTMDAPNNQIPVTVVYLGQLQI